MKTYSAILFDLDGTISDPYEGVVSSLKSAMRELGEKLPPTEKFRAFIGPPLSESFKTICGFPPEKAAEAVKVYRRHHRERGLFENRLYDGISEVIERLYAAGKRLAVATSKPEQFAKLLLEKFGLLKYFEFVGGSELDDARSKKSEVIAYVLENMHIADKSTALMIGDRLHDVAGAAENGLDCAGVLYGYGTLEELSAAGANPIFAQPKDILDLLKR